MTASPELTEFLSRLALLRERLSGLDVRGEFAGLDDDLLVADEELRVQHEELRALREQLESLAFRNDNLFAASPIACVITDVHGLVLNANRAAVALFGEDHRPSTRRPITTRFDLSHRRTIRSMISLASRGGQRQTARVCVAGRDGAATTATVDRFTDPRSGAALLHWELVPAAASASAATAEAVLSRLLLLARADLADDLAHGADGGESLARIVELARQWVPGVEHASVLVRLGDDKHETVASTGPLAVACDEAQAGSPSGPAHDVLAAHRTVRIHDLREDARWPRFAAPALQLGVRSVLICELPASHEAVGTLNLYAREPRAFGDVAELLAPVFASRAAILLAHGDQVNNLRREIDSRQVIAQTVNILMERHQITAEQALERLTRAARQT